ncbi:MAG: SdpI family protein [Planctomycetota bacterium]|jgi:uncharacterized membrane protein
MRLKRHVLISAIIVAAMLVVSGGFWLKIPADQRVPVHWNLAGEPDRFGSKFEALLLIPLVAVGATVLFALLPLLEPRGLNLRRSAKAYAAVWMGVLGLLGIVHIWMAVNAAGGKASVPVVMVTSVGALLVWIGNYLPETRSNFFLGVKTPWTLSSDLSWNRTHRLAGKLFVLLGVGVVVLAFAGQKAQFIGLTAGLAVILPVTAAYSYLVWRADPNKQAIGR